jgi:outer membrane protein, adhesin transport system
MKTRMTLLFTASVVSINTASSADADLNGLASKTASPVLRDFTQFADIPSLTTLVRAPRSRKPAAFNARLPRALPDLPIAVGTARALPDILSPVEKFTTPLPIVAGVGDGPLAVGLGDHIDLAFAQLEAIAEIGPVHAAGSMASAAVETLPEVSPAQAAILVAEPVAETPAASVASVKLPEAPNYVFFDDAEIAPAAGPPPAAAAAMATSDAIYSSENVSLEQAIAAALETNPEVNQAIMNKEAIEFEREQAQGLYAPRVDLEASAGIRRLENGTRRALGIEDNVLYPVEVGIVAEQTLMDFGRRHGELMRQAARTDGAALRVAERSENIALLVSRQYLDILLQQRIVAAADDNVTFHRNLVRDLGQGVTQGSISIADQQQAQERLQAAVVRKTEAEEALVNAQISLQTLTGLSVNSVIVPVSKRASLTPTVNDAIAQARQDNPKVLEAMADVDAAHAMIEKANGDLHPTIGLEGRARIGDDIDGFRGQTNDLQARVVLRWNIFDGGINRAKVQEMTRRASESRFRLHELVRYAEEDVRRAWNSMSTQDKVGGELEVQSRVSDDLLLSYREQFNVGRRSLLDVLDAQNTRYNVQVRLETSRFAEQFAEYQVLAATNNLLDSMSLAAPSAANAYAREKYEYGPSDPAETNRRRYPR